MHRQHDHALQGICSTCICSELAFQISEQFAVLGSALSLRTAVVVGGMDMMAQALELGRRPHVVVGTPGRVVDLLKSCSGEWDLSRIKFLVCILWDSVYSLLINSRRS